MKWQMKEIFKSLRIETERKVRKKKHGRINHRNWKEQTKEKKKKEN